MRHYRQFRRAGFTEALVRLVALLSAAPVSSASFQDGPTDCPSRALHPPEFYLAENRALNNSAYRVRRDATAVTCARDCHADPRCASFNHRRAGGVCELNDAARHGRPVELLEVGGSSYYDHSEGTLLCSAPLSVDNSSCQMLFRSGHRASGVYTIHPAAGGPSARVYCDMETDGGGWIVIQRRLDGSESFSRVWEEYRVGFGDLLGDFWLGNDLIRDLTASSGPWQLIVELGDWDGSTAWAQYDEFRVSGDEYQLTARGYDPASPAGGALGAHDGASFTTTDRDNDGFEWGNCAHDYPGGWWYVLCLDANLNGEYLGGAGVPEGKGVMWASWKGFYRSLKQCRMKIREVKCYHRLARFAEVIDENWA